jgi:hypothetical protein
VYIPEIILYTETNNLNPNFKNKYDHKVFTNYAKLEGLATDLEGVR